MEIFLFSKRSDEKKITQNIISSCYIIFLKTHLYNKIGISDKLKMSFNYLIVNGSFHLRVCAKIAITVVCISIIHAINIYLNFSHEKSGNKQDYRIFKNNVDKYASSEKIYLLRSQHITEMIQSGHFTITLQRCKLTVKLDFASSWVMNILGCWMLAK